MSDNAEHTEKKIGKWALGLAGLGLAAGVFWAVNSGLKELPAEMVSKGPSVQVALPYHGICRSLLVHHQDKVLELSSQDIHSGLARFSFEAEPGEYDLTIGFTGVVPGWIREYPLKVVVDNTPPELKTNLSSPEFKSGAFTTESSFRISGHTEADAQVKLENESLNTEDGAFEKEMELKPGWNHLLLVSQDRAGNQNKVEHSIFLDVEEPELSWKTKPDEIYKKKTARLELQLEDDGEIRSVSGKVDGTHPVQWFAKGGNLWVGTTTELHDGFHEISVKAADASGRVVASKRQVVIDSTEVLGEATLGLGARGEDVKLLHERLAEAGYLGKGPASSVFDKVTEKALKKLQKEEGYKVTGLAEGKVLIALGPRIYINLSNFSLVLDRPGKEEKRWLVSSGTYAHPTPIGKFTIVEKIYHPTWLPPNSDWAKNAKPIPPGPGNPLGTRWMGFDWGGVGIHGTNAPWSIGSAASHGCLRMVTYQVEELFELVEVGTPVTIVGGWEKDPAIEKYWPSKKPEVEKKKEELASIEP